MTLWLLPEVLPGTCVPIGDPEIPAGNTADGYSRWVIASRFRVYSGQARAASLAVPVRVAAPADLLRRGAHVALATYMLVRVGRRDRFSSLIQEGVSFISFPFILS